MNGYHYTHLDHLIILWIIYLIVKIVMVMIKMTKYEFNTDTQKWVVIKPIIEKDILTREQKRILLEGLVRD